MRKKGKGDTAYTEFWIENMARFPSAPVEVRVRWFVRAPAGEG